MEHVQSTETKLLNAEKTALVVIDLQQGIVAGGRQSAPYSSPEVIQNASLLVDAFTEKGAFVILVKVHRWMEKICLDLIRIYKRAKCNCRKVGITLCLN